MNDDPSAAPSPTASSWTSRSPATRAIRSSCCATASPSAPTRGDTRCATRRRRVPRARARPARLRRTRARPADVESYGAQHLTADLVGLLDDAGARRRGDRRPRLGRAGRLAHGAAASGPGAGGHRRERAVHGVAGRPTELLKAMWGDRFFYILYFQEVGPAERELGADIRRTMHAIVVGASGEMYRGVPTEFLPAEGTGVPRRDRARRRSGPRRAARRGSRRSDLDTYVESFSAAGSSDRSAGTATSTPTTSSPRTSPPDHDAELLHRWSQRHGDRRPARLRRGDGVDAARLSRHGADRRRRPLDPAGSGRTSSTRRCWRCSRPRPRRRDVALNGCTAGVDHPTPAAIRAGGQKSSRLYAHHSNGLR